MNDKIEHHSDEGLDLAVYLCLLTLVAATIGASIFSRAGRIMAISIALTIAVVKASLIGFYYMGLRRERALAWIIVGLGLLAVFIMLIGTLPDLTFARF